MPAYFVILDRIVDDVIAVDSTRLRRGAPLKVFANVRIIAMVSPPESFSHGGADENIFSSVRDCGIRFPFGQTGPQRQDQAGDQPGESNFCSLPRVVVDKEGGVIEHGLHGQSTTANTSPQIGPGVRRTPNLRKSSLLESPRLKFAET